MVSAEGQIQIQIGGGGMEVLGMKVLGTIDLELLSVLVKLFD